MRLVVEDCESALTQNLTTHAVTDLGEFPVSGRTQNASSSVLRVQTKGNVSLDVSVDNNVQLTERRNVQVYYVVD